MMKSTKFLAILAGTAMFAACTQEELFEANNTPQQMDEVVGANLVGTDLLMNAYINGSSAQSRYAGGVNAWENNDVVGLGWLVSGVFSDPQTPQSTPASALYANHMFNTENNGATWASKGNLYQGWYFAYHPWSYESAAGKRKGYEMNPAMAGKGAAIHKSQTLYLSNRQFIAADDVNKGNTLSKSFNLYQAVKFIQVTTEAKKGTQFVKGGSLANLPIDSISINVGHGNNIFADRILINAGFLPVEAGYPENPSQAEIDSVKALNLANFQSQYRYVVEVEDAAKDSIVGRNVKAIGLKVSSNPAEDNSYVRMYLNVLPTVAENLDIDKVTVTLHSGAASFVIDNKEGQSAANVEALQSLVNAYKADSTLSNINVVTQAGDPSTLRMNLELRPEDFVTDFSHITNIDEWNQAVELVENLGRTSETFKIDSTIVFTNSIRMPKDCQLKVERATTNDENRFVESLVLGSGTFNEWPANLTSDVYLTIAEDATLKNAHTIKNQLAIFNNGTIEVPAGTKDNVNKIGQGAHYTLTNNGTIKLGKYAKAQRVDNTNGTIEVTYGAYVNIRDNKESEKGKIIYVVTPEDVNKPSRIQKVINVAGGTVQVDYASVNVLRFDAANKLTDFDFTLTSAGTDADDDPYIPTEGSDPTTSTFAGLENVSLEINGVNVKSSKEEIQVNNVTINNATLGAGISVNGDLTVEGGNVNVTTEDITGKLTIKAGQGTITSETIGSVEILDGNYAVNATTIEGDVTATGENYFYVETIKGKVVLTNTNPDAYVNIDGTTFEKDVELNGNFGLVNVNVKGNLTVEGSVKSHNAKVNGSLTVIGGNYKNTADEFTTFGNIEVKNGAEFTTSSDIYTDIIKVYGKVTVAEGKTIWYTVPLNAGGYIQEGTTTGKVLNKSNTALVEELKAAIAEGGNVTLKADVVLPEALVITKNVTIDLNGKTIKNSTAVNNGCGTTSGTTSCVFYVNDENVTLTIEGEGEVIVEAEAMYNIPVWVRNGNVIIKNGKFYSGRDTNDNACHVVYGMNHSRVSIEGGEFKAEGNISGMSVVAVINCQDHKTSDITANITVSGGKFYNFGAAEAAAVGSGEVICKDGYTWSSTKDANGYYSVVKM